MSAARLLEHFDRISEAPDAVPRLRRFILDLAVRGKLADQDAEDEPAADLLTRIQVERVRLMKAGVISGQRLPVVGRADEPFPLPRSWMWTRVGEAFVYDAGTKRDPHELLADRWLVELEDIEKDTSVVLRRLTVADRDSLSTKSEFRAGDVLYGKLRPYLNKVVVAREPGYSTTEIVAIRPFVPLSADYVSLALRRPDFIDYVARLGRGTKMPRLRTPDAVVALFPLPPLAEQHRIVARVDELMALCDQLDTAQSERERRRDRLVAASLDRLNRPADDECLAEAGRSYLARLALLSITRDHVGQLRQAILALAFRGRLVPQLSNEGTGEELLHQVAAERQRIRPTRDRGKKGELVPDPMNCPGLFGVPERWAWSYLYFVCEQIADVDHNMPKAVDDGVPFISAKDLKDDGTIDFSSPKLISEQDYERLSRKVQLRRDDIVYSRIGARLGKARLVAVDVRFLISYSCCLVRPLHRHIDKSYLRLFLDSSLALSQAHRGTQSIGVPDLGLGEIKAFRVPIPPLAEQRRIVAKFEELVAVCGRLEAQLATAQTMSCRLLDSILYEALETRAGPAPSGSTV